MKRREFLRLFVAVAAATPLAARAQQVKPVIGLIGAPSNDDWKKYVASFQQGLKETGFVDGQNVVIEDRWAAGHYQQLPAIAADLVHRKVDVIVAIAPPAVRAAMAATKTIPIVFFTGADPVKLGFVKSLNRPESNVTGIAAIANDIGPKRLQLLREVVPQAAAGALLINPANPNVAADSREIQAAADSMHWPLVIAKASTMAEIDAAFAAFPQQGVGGLVVNPDPFLLGRRAQIAALALRGRVATIFHTTEPVAAGGLMSYGSSFTAAHREVGIYTGRILKGEKPGDLPVPRSIKFETVVNMKTARALGLTMPAMLLAQADEVIE